MTSFLFGLFDNLLSILPNSPFQSLSLSFADSEILGFLNWFIPFDRILSILQLWLTAIAGYYVYIYARKYVSKILGLFFH